ncbi:hypothetical protein D3C71_1791010 [compost metagenome]
MTANAIGTRNSEPSPMPKAVGSMPAAMAKVVMTMGRARSRQAITSASCWLTPSRSASIANSTRRIEFFAASPMSISRPIIAGKPSSAPPTSRPRNAPANESGSAVRIVSGLKKLRNSSTSTA